MGSTWGPWGCADHMGTTWRQHADNVGTTGMWKPHGDNMETTWGQHEDNVGTTGMWKPHGDNMETTWRQHEDNVEKIWEQCGDHRDVETTLG